MPTEADAIFLREAKQRMSEIDRILSAREFPEPGSDRARELWRHAHSLKGTAGSLGHARVEAAAERLARLLDPTGTARSETRPEDENEVRGVVDELSRAVRS
ncbi:MAG: Hpt domain-containing protein, partial [Candidatus Thermoplasmatota archaeon]